VVQALTLLLALSGALNVAFSAGLAPVRVLTRDPKTARAAVSDASLEIVNGYDAKTAGGRLPFRLPMLDRFSKLSWAVLDLNQ
jgi:hypothetical protein